MSTAQSPKMAHLHLHTDGSVLDGACKLDKLFDRAHELGIDAVGITDHGSMTQVLKAQKAAKAASEKYQRDMKSIPGCEIYFTEDRTVKDPSNRYYHLTLLPENVKGYENLCQLTAEANRSGYYYKPRGDYELLKKYGEGLIVLTGCMASRTMQQLMDEPGKDGQRRYKTDKERLAGAREEVLRMGECVGMENVYLEVQNVGVKTPWGDQRIWNGQIAQIAKDLGRPTVGTGDVHYLFPEDADPHDVLLCVQTKALVSTPYDQRMSLLPQKYYMRSYEEMAKLLDNVPESLATTLEIADRCNVKIETGRTFELLPTFPVPESFTPDYPQPDGMEPHVWRGQAYLRHHVMKGLVERYGAPVPADRMQRAEEELEVINNMGVTDYFLILLDLYEEARRRNIPGGPGRGSGAGSIVLYTLGVTQLCPIEHGLLFERFLNPDRISMPDVDMDWPPDQRGELMDYMREKYGEEFCAQIITFGKMGSKASIKRAAQAMGSEYFGLADKMSKAIPTKGTVAQPLNVALEESVELKSLVANNADAKKIIDTALWMEGMIQNESVHAAAFIVSPVPVDTVVPVQVSEAGKGVAITAYDMKDAEGVGLLKLDFLGLRNLSVIQETERLIEKTTGQKIDAWKVPIDDAKTYEMLAKGDSVGVFQFESGGMQDSLRTVGADRFSDLVAIVALYRPGPMAQIPVYARRKKGIEPVTYGDVRLEPILGETQGLVVYQEQSMLVARELCGFTRGEADTLRKAIGKKMADLMAELKPKFMAGAKKNGTDPKVAEELWAVNEASAEYSFNKSHAAAYALISYVTAFLKANYPVQYMSALLTSVMSTKDKVPFYLYETKRMGIEVLPPDVNKSFADFEPEAERAIRFGLAGLKGVGEMQVNEIVEERERGGEFKSLWDFCQRVAGANKKVLESLIIAGAFDFTNEPRKGLLAVIDVALKQAKNIRKKKEAGQDSLFDMLGGSAEDEFAAMQSFDAPKIPQEEFEEMERFRLEREVAGLYVSGHPLDSAQAAWERVREVGLGELTADHISPLIEKKDPETGRKTKLPEKTWTIAGIITSRQTLYTKKNNSKFFKLIVEDLTGDREVMIWPRMLEQNPDLERITEAGNLVWARIHVEEDTRGFGASANDDNGGEDGEAEGAVAEAPEKQLSVSATLVRPFDPRAVNVPEFFDLKLPKQRVNRALLAELKQTFTQHPGTRPVRLIVVASGEPPRTYLMQEYKVAPSDALTGALKRLMTAA